MPMFDGAAYDLPEWIVAMIVDFTIAEEQAKDVKAHPERYQVSTSIPPSDT